MPESFSHETALLSRGANRLPGDASGWHRPSAAARRFLPAPRPLPSSFAGPARNSPRANPERNVPFFSSFSLLDITLSRSATYTPSVAAQHTPIDRPRLKGGTQIPFQDR